MLNVPYSWACDRSPSIVDDIPWGKLLEIGMLMLFGDADLDVRLEAGQHGGAVLHLSRPAKHASDHSSSLHETAAAC